MEVKTGVGASVEVELAPQVVATTARTIPNRALVFRIEVASLSSETPLGALTHAVPGRIR
jgi:hypothetical protein